MRNQLVKALSISRPVFDIVKRDGLTGRVLANYPSTVSEAASGHRHRACNLVTSEGEIIALVSPAIGNGPLNIVIQENAALERVKPGLPAVFSDDQLVVDDSLVILLDGAQLWRPEVNWEHLATQRKRLEDNLVALCDWLSQNNVADGLLGLVLDEGSLGFRRVTVLESPTCWGRGATNPNKLGTPARYSCQLPKTLDKEKEPGAWENDARSPHKRAFLAMARVGIKGLLQALQDGDRSGIRESAALLAGLGPGLTPAGDDYLMGLMAGLRIWSGQLENSGLLPEVACQIILEATEGRTTLLSSAFLHSAKEGLFGENWHGLLAELARGEAIGIRQAARRILSSGATSGADALAGFLSPYLWHRSSDFNRAPRSQGN